MNALYIVCSDGVAFIYPPIHLSHTYTSIHPYLSIHLFISSIPLFTDSSICHLSIIYHLFHQFTYYPFIHLSTYPSMHPSIHPSIHLLSYSSIIRLSFIYLPTHLLPSLPTRFSYLFICLLSLPIDPSTHSSTHKSVCCSNSLPVSQLFSTSHRVNYGFTLHGALGVVPDTW